MRLNIIYSSIAVIALSGAVAQAQLPANPWTTHLNDSYFSNNVSNGNTTDTLVYKDTNSRQTIPVDPWRRTRGTSGTKTWRGSGQQGNLNYIGETTTYTNTIEQEMIAPEVNRHNMIVMLQHLRNMGYKIPTSYDQKIKNMPKNYTRYLRQSINDVSHAKDPFSETFIKMIKSVENYSGLDFNNILFNTMNILGTD